MFVRSSLQTAVLLALAYAMHAQADQVTFPAGTTVNTVFSPAYYQYVERDGFRFTKQLGGLSINAFNLDGNHPQGGGLYVGVMGLETVLVMQRIDGAPFSFETLSILERNSPSGLALTLGGRPHGGAPGTSIEEEFSFDRNTATYDTFNVLAANGGFASVDYVTFVSVESPLVDPSATNYIIDRIVVGAAGPSGPIVSADFNGDQHVDHYDLEAWTANFGAVEATLAQGDADRDMLVDGADFLVWQRQFDGSEIDAPAASLPEPPALSLALTLFTFLVSRRSASFPSAKPALPESRTLPFTLRH